MMKCFEAKMDQLYDMLDFVRSHAKSMDFDNSSINKIELATEEVLVNIISYGYPNRTGEIYIFCLPCQKSKGLKIVIKDSGIPYNPLKNRREFDSKQALEERSIGGYGIFFILNLMDEVNYEREEDFNVLTLVKFGKS